MRLRGCQSHWVVLRRVTDILDKPTSLINACNRRGIANTHKEAV